MECENDADVIQQLEGRIKELELRVSNEVKRGNVLSDLLEDVTLDADNRRREYTTLMEQADTCLNNEMLKSNVKGEMVNYLLDRLICLNGGKKLPKLGRWWSTFAVPILIAECDALSKSDPTHQCFQCFTHAPFSLGEEDVSSSISLTDLFAEDEFEEDTPPRILSRKRVKLDIEQEN